MTKIINNLKYTAQIGYAKIEPLLSNIQKRTAKLWAIATVKFAITFPQTSACINKAVTLIYSTTTLLINKIQQAYIHVFQKPTQSANPTPITKPVTPITKPTTLPLSPDAILINQFLAEKTISGDMVDKLFKELTADAKNDPVLMLQVVPRHPNLALAEVSAELRDNLDFMSQLLKNITPEKFPGAILNEASETLKKNQDFVLQCVTLTGFALCFADPTLQDDDTIALAAVKQHGEAICHASNRLKKDLIVAQAAFQQNNTVLKYIDPSLHETLKTLQKEAINAGIANALAIAQALSKS